jgi:hypothetical protein
MQTVRQEFLAKEETIFKTVDKYKQYFSETDLKTVNSFLKEYFDMLKSDKLFQQKILDSCRKNEGSQSF